jgi:hypothetical protein
VKVADHFEAHDSSSGHPFPQSEPTLGLDTFPQSELDVRRGLVFRIYTVADRYLKFLVHLDRRSSIDNCFHQV